MDLLALVLRWLHLLAAMTAVGGSIFARFVLFPAQQPLAEADRQRLHGEIRRRWAPLVGVSILLLLASGLYNVAVTVQRYELPRWYHPVFGVKFLLAFGVFGIASLLAGRSPAADRMRQNGRFWMGLSVALGVAVVLLSGVLRMADKVPKPAAGDSPPAASAGR